MTEPAHVFLTGATGFLGSFLLAELLQRTRADIHCLVRARDAEAGEERIKRTLAFYSLWDEDLAPKSVPVAGDLSEPLLGLSDERFQELAGEIDTIYHSGASVNRVYPYNALKPINALGTQEVLRLATRMTAKPVHFVSTLGVFPLVGNSDTRAFGEQDPLDHSGVLYNGYTQSKWVAEKLVTIARSRGTTKAPSHLKRPSLAWPATSLLLRRLGHSLPGVLTPNATLRAEIIPSAPANANASADHGDAPPPSPLAHMSWARLLKRVVDIDIEQCPRVAAAP